MSTTNPSSLSFTPQDQHRICTILATRMETLLRREHCRVMYFEALSRQLAERCTSENNSKRSWLARLGLAPCMVTQKCVSDMAASVSMALHVMQLELLEVLAKGEGLDHPLACLLLERLDREHDDVMRDMRMFVYERVDMVREGILHHKMMNKVAVCRKDIEGWIERQVAGVIEDQIKLDILGTWPGHVSVV